MSQKGQTLIEVLVALAALVVVVGSITFSVISALHNDEFSKNQALATQYAQQGLDIIRAMRNANYNNFMGTVNGTYTGFLDDKYCLDSSCTAINRQPSSSVGVNPNLCGTMGNACPNNPNVAGIFTRYVTLQRNSADCPQISPADGSSIDVMEATVTVAWQDSKCPSTSSYCHKVEVSTCLSNANGLQ